MEQGPQPASTTIASLSITLCMVPNKGKREGAWNSRCLKIK